MAPSVTDCERVAYDGGLASGLALALDGVDIAVAAPGRFAAVPADRVRRGWPTVEHRLACQERIALVDFAKRAAPAAEPAAGSDLRLAAARLGVSSRLLDFGIAHLSNRVSGGEPLIRKQLITGTIADLATAVEVVRRQLQAAVDRDPAVLADVHTRIDHLDWQITMLFGASGYLADHPARGLYVSALVANCWIVRGYHPPAGGAW